MEITNNFTCNSSIDYNVLQCLINYKTINEIEDYYNGDIRNYEFKSMVSFLFLKHKGLYLELNLLTEKDLDDLITYEVETLTINSKDEKLISDLFFKYKFDLLKNLNTSYLTNLNCFKDQVYNITSLNLSYSKLRDIDSELLNSSMPKLKCLNLKGNYINLDKIIKFTNLKCLESLCLHNCFLNMTNFDVFKEYEDDFKKNEYVFEFKKLKILDISLNNLDFKFLNIFICRFDVLEELNISNNKNLFEFCKSNTLYNSNYPKGLLESIIEYDFYNESNSMMHLNFSKFLKRFSSLKFLDISKNMLRFNDMIEVTTFSIELLKHENEFQHNNLFKVDLSYNNLDFLLLDINNKASNIKELDLSYCNASYMIILFLEKICFSKLEKLNLSNNKLNPNLVKNKFVNSEIEIIKNNFPNLMDLNLKNCGLSNESLNFIFKWECINIKFIFLSGNYISDKENVKFEIQRKYKNCCISL